jgi:hypothetical protein
MVIQPTAASPNQTPDHPQEFTMLTSVKTAATVFATVALAHAFVLGNAASAMQKSADNAMIPMVVAEPIVVHANTMRIVKAERIEVRAPRSNSAAVAASAPKPAV